MNSSVCLYVCHILLMSDTPSDIPNVSIVMRELTGLSSQVDSILRKNDSRSGVMDSVLLQQQILGIDSSYNKEHRHQQLMNRMRKSVEETRTILYGHQPQQQSYGQARPQQQEPRAFVIPKIKYRHLEKAQQEVPSGKNSKLMNEFYQTEPRKDCATQYQQDPPQDNDNIDTPMANFAMTAKSNLAASQPINHEDVLQRYYDICTRKRRNFGQEKQNVSSRNGSKFMRSRQGGYQQGVERAMRTLLQR